MTKANDDTAAVRDIAALVSSHNQDFGKVWARFDTLEERLATKTGQPEGDESGLAQELEETSSQITSWRRLSLFSGMVSLVLLGAMGWSIVEMDRMSTELATLAGRQVDLNGSIDKLAQDSGKLQTDQRAFVKKDELEKLAFKPGDKVKLAACGHCISYSPDTFLPGVTLDGGAKPDYWKLLNGGTKPIEWKLFVPSGPFLSYDHCSNRFSLVSKDTSELKTTSAWTLVRP